MKQKPLINVENDQAACLAEWISIQHDLRFVMASTKRLCALLDNEEKDGTLMRSLWTAALIAYVRCFSTGKRKAKLSSAIFAHLQGDPIGTHQYYKDTRDMHIAHSVNVFEEVKIGLIPSDTFPDTSDIDGIGHLYVSRVTDDKPGVAQLGRLATVALEYVKTEIAKAEDNFRQSLQSMSRNERKELQILRVTPQGGGKAASATRK